MIKGRLGEFCEEIGQRQEHVTIVQRYPYLPQPFEIIQKLFGSVSGTLFDCLRAKPRRFVSIAHYPGVRGYRGKHAGFLQPIDPLRTFRCADILAPSIIWMRSKAVNSDNTGRVLVVFRRLPGCVILDVRVTWLVQNLDTSVVFSHSPNLITRVSIQALCRGHQKDSPF